MTKKSFILYILLTLVSISAGAQRDYQSGRTVYADRWRNYQRTSYYGLRFGLNVPTLHYKGTGGLAQTNSLARFHLGLVYGNKLGSGLPFYFETGLMYVEKGAEIKTTQETGKRKVTLRYLEVPFVVKYKIETNVDDFTVQPFFGGFVALGVGGKIKNYDTRTKTGSFGSYGYKRFDSGLRIGCGASYQNFYLEMGYDIGLFDISGSKYSDYSFDNFDGRIRTGNFNISLGIDF